MKIQTQQERTETVIKTEFWDELKDLYQKCGIDVFEVCNDLDLSFDVFQVYLDRKTYPKSFTERKIILDYFKDRICKGDYRREYCLCFMTMYKDLDKHLGSGDGILLVAAENMNGFEDYCDFHTFKANSWKEAKMYKEGFENGWLSA